MTNTPIETIDVLTKDEAHALVHRLWTRDVHREGYVKGDWQALERYIHQLQRRAPAMFKVMYRHLLPALRSKCPKSIPWEFVHPHESQAKRNHGQTLKRLNERGGLAPNELVAVIDGREWRDISRVNDEEAVDFLVDWLRQQRESVDSAGGE